MRTYKIEYGDSIIDGGLFLKNPAMNSSAVDYADHSGDFFRHLSTFTERSTIRECLIEHLDQAQKHIFFASFLIQDDQIIQHLVEAAKRLKGHVYVLTTLKKNDFEVISLLQDDADHHEWDFNAHMECVKYLATCGISVKARKDCHAKFAVFDDQSAVITSANAVPTCYTNIKQSNGHMRKANPENGVLIEIPSEVDRIANFFRSIWRSAYNYYIAPDRNFSDVGEFSKDIIPVHCEEPTYPSDKGQIIWTAPDDFRILNSLLEMIDTADHKLRISSYVFKGLSGHLVSRKLQQAAKRDVEIEVFVRGMSRRDHLDSCYHLKKTLGDQIRIYGDFYNHSKSVVVDDKQAMILTANLDSQHGLDSSVEVGFVSSDFEFVTSVSRFLDRLRAECVLEFIANPRQSQAGERFSTLHNPVLAQKENLTININHYWKNRNKVVDKLITTMQRQIIKISGNQQNGRKNHHLSTDDIIVEFIHNGDGRLNVQRVIETPEAANLRYKQILTKSVITINVK
jgi:phosphatidylserine/phosphatidylglycerophosphate/cardiolipin synthase-like enzyme